MKRDSISVVIPCHNEEKMIGKCIKSIKNQTYKPIEIIVVDDGSTDKSINIAKKYNVKIIQLRKNSGEAIARSIGALASKGKYIAEIDADAIYPKNWIEDMYKTTKKEGAIGCVYGYIKPYSKKQNLTTRFWRYKRQATYLLRSEGKREIKGLWFFNRKIINDIGLYDKEMLCGSDVDFSKRVEKAGYKIAWAKDTYIIHNDPSNFLNMLKRLWWGAVNCKKFEQKWGSSFKLKNIVLLAIRNLAATLIPLFLFLSLQNPIFLIISFIIFASEGIFPILIPEWKLILKLALAKKDVIFIIFYPFILWSIARITAYGKMYAFLFK